MDSITLRKVSERAYGISDYAKTIGLSKGLYWERLGTKQVAGEQWVTVKFWAVDPGNPPTIERSLSGSVPLSSISQDLEDEEITINRPIVLYR